MSTTGWTFLLYHAYYHAPNALRPPLSTAAGNINNNEGRPGGRDGPEGGGAQCPPTAMAIAVIIVVIDDGGGGVKANDQRPMPHATKERPADDVATIVVGFPLVICSTARPLPILCIVVFVVIVIFVVIAVILE